VILVAEVEAHRTGDLGNLVDVLAHRGTVVRGGRIDPEPSCFRTFFVCVNCLIRRLTSATEVPLQIARSWPQLQAAVRVFIAA
jgi:hypothetical protein